MDRMREGQSIMGTGYFLGGMRKEGYQVYTSGNVVYKVKGKLEFSKPDHAGYKDYMKRDLNEQGMGIARSYGEIDCYVNMGIIAKKDRDAIMEFGNKLYDESRPKSRKHVLKNAIALRDALRTSVTTGTNWVEYMDFDGLALDLDALKIGGEKEEANDEDKAAGKNTCSKGEKEEANDKDKAAGKNTSSKGEKEEANDEDEAAGKNTSSNGEKD